MRHNLHHHPHPVPRQWNTVSLVGWCSREENDQFQNQQSTMPLCLHPIHIHQWKHVDEDKILPVYSYTLIASLELIIKINSASTVEMSSIINGGGGGVKDLLYMKPKHDTTIVWKARDMRICWRRVIETIV